MKNNTDSEVLLDKDGIKVTYTGFDNDTTMGVGFKLLIENNTDKTVTVQTRDETVNGFMVDGVLSADVAAGKKANEVISIWDSDLENSDIDEIKVYEFKLNISDADNWDTIMETETITLTNSDATEDANAKVPDGQLLVDEAGIKIIFVDTNTDEYSGEQLRFYIENNTDEDISINTDKISLNGFMVDASMYSDILAHRKAYT